MCVQKARASVHPPVFRDTMFFNQRNIQAWPTKPASYPAVYGPRPRWMAPIRAREAELALSWTPALRPVTVRSVSSEELHANAMRDEDALQMPILGKAPDAPVRSSAADWASFPTSRNYVTRHVLRCCCDLAYDEMSEAWALVSTLLRGVLPLSCSRSNAAHQLHTCALLSCRGLQILSMLAWVGSGGNPDYGTGLTESFWSLDEPSRRQ